MITNSKIKSPSYFLSMTLLMFFSVLGCNISRYAKNLKMSNFGSSLPIDIASMDYSPILQPELRLLSPREYDKSVLIMLGLSEHYG
jgi:hypothetical protein